MEPPKQDPRLDSNLIPLSRANGGLDATDPPRAAPAEPGEKPKARSKKDRIAIAMHYVRAMSPKGPARGAPFGGQFKVIADPRGVRRPVQVLGGDVVRYVDEMAVRTEILRYAHMKVATKGLLLDSRDAKMVYDLWCALEVPLDEKAIAPVRQLTEEGYTWRRLPWDFKGGSPTPVFDEMMGRTGNAEALMAWIGALFDPAFHRQAYVYLHGEGGNGKGQLAAFLERVFGDAYKSEHVSDRPGNFWTSGLLGSRLVVFPDFESRNFPNTGFFKSLTGGDAVRIEEKGRQPYTAQLTCMFMFLANGAPVLDESPANRRRAIYCRMEAITGREESAKAYGAKLWSEGPSWLAGCVARYQGLVAVGAPKIPTNDDSLTEIIDSHEEPYIELVLRWFDVGVEHETTPTEMQAILTKEGMKDFRHQCAFLTFLGRRFDVKKVRTNQSGNPRYRVYRGLQVKAGLKNTLQTTPRQLGEC